MKTFQQLQQQYHCRPIRNCPGRFVITDTASLSLVQLVECGDEQIKEFQSPHAKDTILIVTLDQGGVISYLRSDGSYLHTLNTTEGWQRKLSQLEIDQK